MDSDRISKTEAMEALGLKKSAYHKYLGECEISHFRENGELYLAAEDFRSLQEHIGSKKGMPIVTVVNEDNGDGELETTAIAPTTIPANWQEILEDAIALKVAESNREELVKEVASQLTEEDIPPELREKKKAETAIAILNQYRQSRAKIAA